ncbi:MAG: protein kinase, partial [Deltaproteobacteria bacterium]
VLLALQHDAGSDFKRLVVVKKILDELVEEDPQFIKMFLDEARLGARLSHPNIVQTFEVGESGNAPYLAMEFLDGQALNILQRRARLKQEQLPVDVALRIVCDVLDALHYAHELRDFDGSPLSVIHRDVTPSNIFVKYDGLTKLVDFGIAKSATQREKTRAGTLKGKVPYMAPELLRDEAVTRSVDVWAVGAVLWETLALERLFLGKNDFTTVQNVMSKKAPPLSERRKDIPASLDEVIASALDRNPKTRIQTALEFKERLEDEAVKMGKTLRASSVSRSMGALFGDLIEQNKNLVRDFLEGGSAAKGEELRVRSTGTMEMVLPAPDEALRDSLEVSSRPSGSLSRSPVGEVPTTVDLSSSLLQDEPATTLFAPTAPGESPKSSPRPAASKATPTPKALPSKLPPARKQESKQPAGAVSLAVPDAETALEEDEYEPRPAWHWAMLVGAISLGGFAVYFLLLK